MNHEDVYEETPKNRISAGIIALVAGLLRLGFLAGFISEPVMKGFIIGLALTIIAGQLPKLFGVHLQKENFFLDLYHLGQALPQSSWLTLGVGLVTLVVLVFMELASRGE